MLLKEVPASDPTTPAFANAVNPAVVSSIDRPAFAATEPTCFIASVMSRTEPCALPAPAAEEVRDVGEVLPRTGRTGPWRQPRLLRPRRRPSGRLGEVQRPDQSAGQDVLRGHARFAELGHRPGRLRRRERRRLPHLKCRVAELVELGCGRLKVGAQSPTSPYRTWSPTGTRPGTPPRLRGSRLPRAASAAVGRIRSSWDAVFPVDFPSSSDALDRLSQPGREGR